MDDEINFNLGTGMHVITITYDDNGEYPIVDLGDCSPWMAIPLFKSISETLEMLLPAPSISYEGKTIISPVEDEDENNS